MLQSFQHSDFATQFHKTYYLNLMQETFAVMTGNKLSALSAISGAFQHVSAYADGVSACMPALSVFELPCNM